MVPLLSEVWRFIGYLLRPDDVGPGAQQHHPLACAVKAVFWACMALLAGLGLGQLHG